jgi:hypothetical protein
MTEELARLGMAGQKAVKTPLSWPVFGQMETFLGVLIESKYHQNT